MKKALFISLLCIHGFFLAYSQEETSNWYFGNGAGLHFNNDGSVTPIIDGQINTIEGCATISDKFGDLLFYTDGITVYDRNHSIMMNGTGLYGDSSSTQSAIIVPKPQDPNLFYIFTVDTSSSEEDPDEGLNYSVVDISENGGNGSVTEKNTRLLEDCSEKITAVIKDCSNKSIWLITLASEDGTKPNSGLIQDAVFNTYHSFEINTTGVNPIAVKTTITDLEVRDSRGSLKLSSDGTKLASANIESGLFLYDFDADTGKLSNQKKIDISIDNFASYGLEFSPNNQYLYVVSFNNLSIGQRTGHSSSLLQFDIQAPDISNSIEIIDTKPIYRGSLQLANNGKIYRTTSTHYLEGSSFLGVINNPNEKGINANYEHNAVYLDGKIAQQGLPPFIQSFFNKIDLIKNDDGTASSSLEVCEGDSFILEAEDYPGATYNWYKDNIPFINPDNYFLEVSTSKQIDAGRYKVEIILADTKECPIIGESTIKINFLPEANTITLTQCDADENSTDGITTVNLKQVIQNEDYDYFFYKTIADRDSDIPIETPVNYTNTTPFNQTIYYKIVNEFECENLGEIILNIKSIDITNNSPVYLYQCDENTEDNAQIATFDIVNYAVSTYVSPENYSFYTTIEDAILEQNPIKQSLTTESTTIYGREENINQCQDIFKINLVVNPIPEFDIEPSYIICTDGPPLTINGPDNFNGYRWLKAKDNVEEEISLNKTATILEPGTYILEVSTIYYQNNKENICKNSKTFEVIPSNRALIQDVKIKDISNNNTVEILVSGNGDYEYSIDGINYQNSPLFNDVLPGIITVYTRDKNSCGISEKEVSVIGYPKFLTPNGDFKNDTWQIKGTNNMFQANSIISIFDRFGGLIAQIQPTSKGWDGTINGQPLPASNYWFKVNLEDGREFKGNFVLKR